MVIFLSPNSPLKTIQLPLALLCALLVFAVLNYPAYRIAMWAAALVENGGPATGLTTWVFAAAAGACSVVWWFGVVAPVLSTLERHRRNRRTPRGAASEHQM